MYLFWVSVLLFIVKCSLHDLSAVRSLRSSPVHSGHPANSYSKKTQGKNMEINSSKGKDSKLCPGNIANSFFDAFRSSAGQYKDGIQLLSIKSTKKVCIACKYTQKGISHVKKYRKILFYCFKFSFVCILLVACVCHAPLPFID